MEIGISIFSGMKIENQVKCFKKAGVNRTFVMSDIPDFDAAMKLFKDNDIICETLHAPFNGINNIWGFDENGAGDVSARLKDAVDKCKKYDIPTVIFHLSSGRPMPEINEIGVKRFEYLFEYAEKNGVTVALENQRYLENLSYFLNNFPITSFCWDCGHEYCFTTGIRFMEHFGKRLAALHIHDNRCGINTDDHLLPFDGNIDFEVVTQNIADSGYKGTLMLEVGKLSSIDGLNIYAAVSDEDYVMNAANVARKLADMTAAKKKKLAHEG